MLKKWVVKRAIACSAVYINLIDSQLYVMYSWDFFGGFCSLSEKVIASHNGI